MELFFSCLVGWLMRNSRGRLWNRSCSLKAAQHLGAPGEERLLMVRFPLQPEQSDRGGHRVGQSSGSWMFKMNLVHYRERFKLGGITLF